MTATDGRSKARLAPSGTPAPATDVPGSSSAGAGPEPGRKGWPARLTGLVRRHWLVSLLLVAGIVARGLSQAAYHPALLYVDSLKYLYGVWPGADPLGYKILLRVLLHIGDLGFVELVQHLLGLGMAVALYVVLVHRGCARWLAALATAPVLLDAYQLQMEATIMPDVWFEALIVAALVLLLWRTGPTLRLVIVTGLVLGISATMREIGEILILPALAYVLLAAGPWRRGGWRKAGIRSAALIVAFLLPVVAYCGVSYHKNGHFRLAAGSNSAPGRLAAAADCATLTLPKIEQPMCPAKAEQAKGPDWLEHSKKSPLHTTPVPLGMTHAEMQDTFDSAVEHQQPLRVITAIGRDAVRLFAPTRRPAESVTAISRWQFQDHFPTYHPYITLRTREQIFVGLQRKVFGPFRFRLLLPSYGGHSQVDQPLARFLRSYQLDGGYTPGPLLAFCLIAGLAGSLMAFARRKRRETRSRQLARACLLVTVTAVAVLLASDVFEFSWRYQLPALVTLPVAGALGIAVFVGRWHERRAAAPAAETDEPEPAPEPSRGAAGPLAE